uniref:Disease resistance protein At4g11170 family n=1 Tax=Cajanus cajan TaxID=3821 RepID=A0A151T9F1_CAJCA|nr:Putative disease resistance protein At4g11170 family [Cajanus cajan]
MPYSSRDNIKYVVFVFVWLLLAKETAENNNPWDPSDTPHIKYDVFVSFRGADIRQDFLSHLVEAFYRNQIAAFVDYKILKGDELAEALLGAIQGSLISLVIFSQRYPAYASSRWCLLELAKIVECRKEDGQLVLPVFYRVDPSHVRHQKGTYADAFVEHERKYSLTTLQTWRSALNESANLSGFDSSTFRDEAELVKEVVKCVSKRLNHVHQVNSKGLVGISKRIAHVESLLQLEARGVLIVGIWGMGGIGKTTIAQEVYSKLCSEYEGCCFLANIREESERHGIISLKKKLFSTLLGEDLKIDTPNGLPQYVERRLHRTKVLIILDDVNDSGQLEILAGTSDWFGSGSRIIITTRDKQVLPTEFANIYEVEALNFDESLRLFNLNAFKQNHLEREYRELSKKVVDYAKGIPLVLKVLVPLLRGKSKEIWKSHLERLRKVQSKKVHDIIKLSYDDLDWDEKKIFLDIACFFDGLNLKVKYVESLLKDHGHSVAAALERLKDKALISVSQENIVSMHNIVQETGWQIAHQESIEDPRSQSRLLDPDHIYEVLKYNKGNEAIRSIVINLSGIKDLHLNLEVFAKMSKLQFLDFYRKGSCSCSLLRDEGSLHLPQGLESLPNELRYLRWTHYPLESLPSKFSGENLVELNMPYSRVKKLWQEVPDVVNLKVFILHSSLHLKELPDFSKAINLERIDLRFCVGLTSVHPSVFSLNKLKKLNLGGCFSLTSLQSNIHLDSLRYLSLYGCMALKHFSVTSKNMVKLNLELTAIKQLPSSIGLQTKLEKLFLGFTYVENLPPSIKHLTSLRHLDVRHCKNLQTLPELPPSLETLDASGCISLETVKFPSSAVEQLKENKKRVAFWNCFKLDAHSLKAIALNAQINMMKFAHQHLSTFGDAQGTYVNPGSKVPKWLEHKTTRGYMTIDVSFVLAPHSSHLGFIFGFIVPKVPYGGSVLEFNIRGGEGEGNKFNVYLNRPSHEIKVDHVYLMFDQACSRYLHSIAKHQPRLKIKVSVAARTLTSNYVPLQLRGFGISTINTTQYLGFVQNVELCESSLSYVPILVKLILSFCIAVSLGTFSVRVRILAL